MDHLKGNRNCSAITGAWSERNIIVLTAVHSQVRNHDKQLYPDNEC